MLPEVHLSMFPQPNAISNWGDNDATPLEAKRATWSVETMREGKEMRNVLQLEDEVKATIAGKIDYDSDSKNWKDKPEIPPLGELKVMISASVKLYQLLWTHFNFH